MNDRSDSSPDGPTSLHAINTTFITQEAVLVAKEESTMPFKRAKSGFNKREQTYPAGKQYGGKPSSRPSYGGGTKSNFELFEATCEKCNKRCEVPFRPSNGKPVYCRDCFSKNDNPPPNRPFPPRQSQSDNSADLQEINRKLDKIMRALKID